MLSGLSCRRRGCTAHHTGHVIRAAIGCCRLQQAHHGTHLLSCNIAAPTACLSNGAPCQLPVPDATGADKLKSLPQAGTTSMAQAPCCCCCCCLPSQQLGPCSGLYLALLQPCCLMCCMYSCMKVRRPGVAIGQHSFSSWVVAYCSSTVCRLHKNYTLLTDATQWMCSPRYAVYQPGEAIPHAH
jgi:hypothetical protein